MRSWLWALPIVFVLAGCPAHKAWKEGVMHQEAGKDWVAAQDYLHALQYNPKFGKAQMSLWDVAPHAYEIQLNRAEDAEMARNWPTALSEYKTLDEFIKRANAFGSDLKTIDVPSKIDEIENSAAREQYALGEKAFTEKRWSDAIAAWNATLGFKANYKDTNARIGGALYAWAGDDLAAKAWRDAAARYQDAAAHQGPADAKSQAAGIYGALGKYFLDQKVCRQAVHDLTAAAALTTDANVAKNLGLAQGCAIVPMSIGTIENPTGIPNVGGVAVAVVLAEAVQARMATTGSEFVRVLAPTSGGLKYKVEGRLTQVKLEGPVDTKTPGTAAGSVDEACTVNDANGVPVASTCPKPVTLSYTDHKGKVRVRLVGSARIVDVTQKNKEIGVRAFDLALDDTTHWADGFKLVDAPVNPADYKVAATVIELSRSRAELADEGELAKQLADSVANDVAPYLVGLVDVETPAADPRTLTVKALP